MQDKTTRKSNFELLRIVSMFFIVLYHTIIHGHVIENSTNPGLTMISNLLLFICIVHVNSYVLVSGYFQSKSTCKQSKVWSLINADWFYRVIIVIILTSIGAISLSKVEFLKQIFIIDITDSYWFVKFYIAIYLLSPFLNKLIEGLNKKEYNYLLIILTVLLSIIPYLTGEQGFSNNGFTIQHFIYLYLIGGYLRKFPIGELAIFRKYSKEVVCIIIFFSCAILNYIIYKSSQSLNNVNSLVNDITNNLMLMSRAYSNPIVIVQTVAFVLFFETLNIRSKIINDLATLTLGIYLVHDNPLMRGVLYQWLKIDNGPVSSYSFILYIFIVSFAIYFTASLVEWIRQLIFHWIYNRKIPTKIRQKYYSWLNKLQKIDTVKS